MSVERLRRRLRELDAPAAELSPRQPVMLATLVDEPFSSPDWIFEIKYDGVRVLAHRAGPKVELSARSGQVITERYPEVAAALAALALDHFLLDGEIVALDERGRPSFQRLQARMGLSRAADVERMRGLVPVTAVFFDALGLDGHDLRTLPLGERKACLELLIPAAGVIRYGDHVTGDGEGFFRLACEQHLEGIVAKRRDSRYTGTRSRDWLKLKCQRRQEFVIGGYTDPQGARSRFGALHLGVYEGDRLVYVSKVGTGFTGETLDAIWNKLVPLRRPTSPFAVGTPTGRGHHWVEPKLVAEVRFTEWTDDGGLRHPAFLGLRDDKKPEECRRELSAPPPEARKNPWRR